MKINQILWAIADGTQKVVPLKVTEKIITETAAGVVTEYVVQTTAGKRLQLSKLGSPYFEELQEVNDHLTNAARQLIQKVLSDAEEQSKQFLKSNDIQQEVLQNANTGDTMNQEELQVVTLPDGRKAKVRINVPEFS